jgi:hypothetical protein
MGMEENKKVVLKLFEAMARSDISGTLDLLAEDATWWVIGDLPGISGTRNKQQISVLMERMMDSAEGAKIITDHLIAEGDYVAVEVHADGLTKKGKTYNQMYHFKFEVKDGRIRAIRAYNDTSLIKEVILDV